MPSLVLFSGVLLFITNKHSLYTKKVCKMEVLDHKRLKSELQLKALNLPERLEPKMQNC